MPIFFRKPASYEFSISIDEGRRILSHHVNRHSWDNGFHESLIGKVTATDVRIWHYCLTALSNQTGVIPVFIGKFSNCNGKPKLVGEFRLNKLSKYVIILCFIFILLFWGGIAIRDYEKPFFSLGLIVEVALLNAIFMIIVVCVGYWGAKRDMKYIESRVKEILSKGSI